MNDTRKLTHEQLRIVKEYHDIHGIEPSQISFDGDDPYPSFDHNAISILSLKLTDIQDISPTKVIDDAVSITVFGTVTLPDGRTRGSIGSALIGETLANGQKVENAQQAIGVATSRCFRQGIRNVGVKLHEAHCKFVETGEIADGHTNRDPRHAIYAEIHILATELDLIIDGNKGKYYKYLADNYEGRTSSTQLNDVELQKMLIQFRSLARLRRSKEAA